MCAVSRPSVDIPVLVQACVDAVKDWKYEPAAEETTQIVEFEFRANSSGASDPGLSVGSRRWVLVGVWGVEEVTQ